MITELIYDGEVFKIEAYVEESNKTPVINWLNDLDVKEQVKFAALFARLGDQGKIYNEQKFKHLSSTNQIFEFKVSSGRILSFFFAGKRVVLTHGFTKKGAKTPKREIERAEKIKKDFEQRVINEKN